MITDVEGPNGRYAVTGEVGCWQVMERFGSYRIGKKRFTNFDKAVARARHLAGLNADGSRDGE